MKGVDSMAFWIYVHYAILYYYNNAIERCLQQFCNILDMECGPTDNNHISAQNIPKQSTKYSAVGGYCLLL